jgi:hypothetical protein
MKITKRPECCKHAPHKSGPAHGLKAFAKYVQVAAFRLPARPGCPLAYGRPLAVCTAIR